MKTLSAIILAGGKSTRMGSDKAFLPWGESTFLGQIITAVLPLTGEIYLSGDDERLYNFGFPVVNDLRNDQGPVVALASCFRHIKTDLVLVLSCDVPQIKFTDLEALLKAHTKNFDATFYSSNNRDLPLVAIYSKSSFNAFEEALQSGERKLFTVLGKLKNQAILFTRKGGLLNINTKEELKAAL
jgi:molybdopterin-guanine dinucleotide biosynthesis protein A